MTDEKTRRKIALDNFESTLAQGLAFYKDMIRVAKPDNKVRYQDHQGKTTQEAPVGEGNLFEFDNVIYEFDSDVYHPVSLVKSLIGSNMLVAKSIQEGVIDAFRDLQGYDKWEFFAKNRIFGKLVAKKTPLYFVGRDLAEALVQSDDQTDDWDLSQLPLPFDPFVFYMPKGICKGNDKWVLVGVTRVQDGEQGGFPFDGLATYLVFEDESQGGALGGESLYSEAWGDLVRVNTEQMKVLPNVVSSREGPVEIGGGVVSAQPNLNLFSFLKKLIMVMDIRPGIVAEPQVIKRQKSKRRGVPGKLRVTPRYVGKDFNVARDRGGGQGSTGDRETPRMHWRRGHFRRQRHGPKRIFTKTIWVEPVLVNAVAA